MQMSRISRCSWSVALLVFFFFLPVHHASDRNKTRKLAESSMADGFVWISRPSNVRTATGQSVAVDCQALWKSRIFNGTWTRFITTDSVQGNIIQSIFSMVIKGFTRNRNCMCSLGVRIGYKFICRSSFPNEILRKQ